jgi:hypothetical protein
MTAFKNNSFLISFFLGLVALFFLFSFDFLIVDEEFFILLAFSCFGVFVYQQVTGVISSGLTDKIRSLYLKLIQSREMLLRLSGALYLLYADFLKLFQLKKQLQPVFVLETVDTWPLRRLDVLYHQVQYNFQANGIRESVVLFLGRTVSLAILFRAFGTVINSPSLLESFSSDPLFDASELDAATQLTDLESTLHCLEVEGEESSDEQNLLL